MLSFSVPTSDWTAMAVHYSQTWANPTNSICEVIDFIKCVISVVLMLLLRQ